MRKHVKLWLDKSSLFFRIDLHYFAKGSFWLTLQQLSTAMSGFLLSLVYAHFVPKIVFGQYTFVFSFVNFFGSFAYPGIATAITRAVAQGREGIVREASSKTLSWSIVSATPLLMIGGYYALKTPPDYFLATAFAFSAVLSVPIWIYSWYSFYFFGKGQFNILFWLSVLSSWSSFLVMSLVSTFTSSMLFMVTASLGVNVVVNLAFTIWTFRKITPFSAKQEDFDYAKSLNDIKIFGFIGVFVDKLIIGKTLGFEALAIYTFAQLFPEQLKGFLKNLASLALPLLSQKNVQQIQTTFYQKMGWFFGLSVTIVGGYILLAPWLFKLFFPSYQAAVWLSQILAVSVVTTPSLLVIALFESQKNVAATRWNTYITYSTQIGLLAILTPLFGLTGSVMAILTSRCVSLITTLILLKKFAPWSGQPKSYTSKA